MRKRLKDHTQCLAKRKALHDNIIRQGAPKHVSSEGEAEVIPVICDEERGELIVELIRTRWVLSEAGIANLSGRIRIRILVIGLAQDVLVVTQSPPRKVWDWVTVMRHAPVVQAKAIVPIGKGIVADTGLSHGVDVINGKAMGVQSDGTVSRLRSAERVTSDDQLAARQILNCDQDLRSNAVVSVVKTWVTVATIAPLIRVARRWNQEDVINPSFEIRIGAHESHDARPKRRIEADNCAGIGPFASDLGDVLEAWNRLARDA